MQLQYIVHVTSEMAESVESLFLLNNNWFIEYYVWEFFWISSDGHSPDDRA